MAVNGELASALQRLQEVALRNGSLFAEGEHNKGRAQQVLESLSPQLCIACGERPRISQRIQVCEVCYREIEQEIKVAEQDGYAAMNEVEDVDKDC